MKRLLVAALLVGCAAFPGIASAAEKRHVLEFPSGVDIVNLNVSVLAGRDRFVTDLALRDFAVYENGVRQEATVFAREELPISMVLMLDMSASMVPQVEAVRRAASRLIATLRPQDEAQVIEFNDRSHVLQSFTSDQALLNEAVQRARPMGATALHKTLYVTLKDLEGIERSEGLRRRAVVLLSDGEDTASLITDDQVLEAARACEISIYSILLGGAEGRSSPTAARYLLSALAQESGGQAFFPTSVGELAPVYDRIALELRSQYNIGYVSNNVGAKGGRWRQILVLTPQRDDVEIRHRVGYYVAGDRSGRGRRAPVGIPASTSPQ
jgi:Ca-activated chloride channel family protein